MPVTIEKGVPIPEYAGRIFAPKYKIDQLEVGDCSHVPFAFYKSIQCIDGHLRLYRRKTGKCFVVRKQLDGARIWRTK